MQIRMFRPDDEAAVIALWQACGLTRPWNDPQRDIARKLSVQPELFLIGVDAQDRPVASAMVGYDGHRGSLYYLAVHPELQGQGWGRRLMAEAEARLTALGAPKLNLLVRSGNRQVLGFYARLGYGVDEVLGLGKRLIADGPATPAPGAEGRTQEGTGDRTTDGAVDRHGLSPG